MMSDISYRILEIAVAMLISISIVVIVTYLLFAVIPAMSSTTAEADSPACYGTTLQVPSHFDIINKTFYTNITNSGFCMSA